MIGAIHQRNSHIDHRETERALFQIFHHPFFNRWNPLLRHHTALDLIDESEARSAGHRLDLDHHVAELPMAARLPLVAAALARSLSDGFLIGHARRVHIELEAIFARQLFRGDLQMDFALSQKRDFAQCRVLFEQQRRIFLLQSVDRGGQLHLVLAIRRFDRQLVNGRQHRGRYIRQRRILAGGQKIAGFRRVHPQQRNGVTRHRLRQFLLRLPFQRSNAANPRILPVARIKDGAIFQRAGQNTAQADAPAMAGMIGLQNLGDRFAIGFEPMAARYGTNIGHFMAQCLQQAADAIVAFRRSHQRRNEMAIAQFPGQFGEDGITFRLHIAQQIFHQMLIEIRELLQHLKACILFTVAHIAGQLQHLAWRVRAIDKGALQREIDIAGDDIAIPDGNLAQQKRFVACVLQHRQQRTQRTACLVDLVDEQEMRNVQRVQPLQIGLQHLNLGRFGFANHDRRIDTGQDIQAVLQKFDGAGTIQKGETVAQIFGGGAVDFHTHAPGTGLGAGIADRITLCDVALAMRGAGCEQNAFQQRGFPAAIGSYQGHCTWPASSIPVWHNCLPSFGFLRRNEARRALFPKAGRRHAPRFVEECSRRQVPEARGHNQMKADQGK